MTVSMSAVPFASTGLDQGVWREKENEERFPFPEGEHASMMGVGVDPATWCVYLSVPSLFDSESLRRYAARRVERELLLAYVPFSPLCILMVMHVMHVMQEESPTSQRSRSQKDTQLTKRCSQTSIHPSHQTQTSAHQRSSPRCEALGHLSYDGELFHCHCHCQWSSFGPLIVTTFGYTHLQ